MDDCKINLILYSIAVGRTGSSSEHVEQHVLVLPSQESKMIWLVSFSSEKRRDLLHLQNIFIFHTIKLLICNI